MASRLIRGLGGAGHWVELLDRVLANHNNIVAILKEPADLVGVLISPDLISRRSMPKRLALGIDREQRALRRGKDYLLSCDEGQLSHSTDDRPSPDCPTSLGMERSHSIA